MIKRNVLLIAAFFVSLVLFLPACTQQPNDASQAEANQEHQPSPVVSNTAPPAQEQASSRNTPQQQGNGPAQQPATGERREPQQPLPAFRKPAFRNNPELPSGYEQSQLRECSDVVYSVLPVDISKLTSITPLGNLAPPGHTFPTEHTYLHFSPGGATTETHPLFLPADAHVLLVLFSYGMTQDPVDYTIYFAPCKDVAGYYNHVKELSPALQKVVDDGSCEFQGETKSTRCHIQAFVPVRAGELVGSVGRLQGNFDFGTIDARKTLSFANPSRYGKRSLHIQCPYDYYDPMNRGEFFNLMHRDGTGQCGTVAQDIPGALKGNWFFGTARADSGSDWDKHLAFVNDNNDPSLQVISIGGVVTNAGKLEFTPEPSGFVNTDFSQVKPDGNIYCYEGTMPGMIIVQMTSDTALSIEHQDGSCGSGPWSFRDPTQYER